jgi:hypothetical protein
MDPTWVYRLERKNRRCKCLARLRSCFTLLPYPLPAVLSCHTKAIEVRLDPLIQFCKAPQRVLRPSDRTVPQEPQERGFLGMT